MQAAGTAASGDPVYVEDVFSTHLYNGNSGSQSINNGIDLAGEGGLVWIKSREDAADHALYDTERNSNNVIHSNSDAAQDTYTPLKNDTSNAFTSTGFDLNTATGITNNDAYVYASWTFRKQEGFFDIVTYTGTGSSKTVSHNLGSVPGMIIVKMISSSGYKWRVWHKSLGNSKALCLNDDSAESDDGGGGGGWWNNTAPTSSVFSVGTYGQVNNNGDTFVAYLFGEEASFGDDSDEAIVKCGTFTTSSTWGLANAECGFEPQWVMYKRTDDTEAWEMIDNMRGCATKQGKWNGTDDGTQYSSVSTSNDQVLKANTTAAEANEGRADFHSTGFSVGTGGANDTYIFIAIRRGPMKEPSAGTDVYNYQTRGGGGSGPPAYIFPHPVDWFLQRELGGTDDWYTSSRLIQGKYSKADETDAATNSTFRGIFDFQNGFGDGSGTASSQIAYAWRRYPKVFDILVMTGTGSAQVVNHNLGVVPEFMISKTLAATGYTAGGTLLDNWFVWSSHVNATQSFGFLNTDGTDVYSIMNQTPTATQLTLQSNVAYTGDKSIKFLFASLDGISKVGTYTGTGSAINVDCGFSGGARWVMVKRTDASADWYIVSSGRGFGKHLKVNSDADESSTAVLDTLSAGFTVRSDAGNDLNANGGTYFYLAFS